MTDMGCVCLPGESGQIHRGLERPIATQNPICERTNEAMGHLSGEQGSDLLRFGLFSLVSDCE
jgi:hypothetical protein